MVMVLLVVVATAGHKSWRSGRGGGEQRAGDRWQTGGDRFGVRAVLHLAEHLRL